MDGDVIEVVVRLGATVLDVRVVGGDERYRIGTAAGVELPLAIATSFALVDTGLRIRRPAGVAAILRIDERALRVTDTELVVERGATVELRIGMVAIELARIPRPRAQLPSARFDRRPMIYALASLAVHVVVWAVAMSTAPFELVAHARIARPIVRVHAEEPELPPPPIAHKPNVASASSSPSPHAARAAEQPAAGFGAGLSDLSMLMPSAEFIEAVKHAGPTYDEDAARAKGFGGARHFDPTGRPEFGTVASHYATVAHGRGAGDDYALRGETPTPAPPVIEECGSLQCDVAGGRDFAAIRAAIHAQRDDLISCYRRRDTVETAGEIALDFDIAPDGKVRDARGSGLVTVGACIADVLTATAFPPADRDTHVHYTLNFRPGTEPHRSQPRWHPTELP